jgi:hypothetical protein
MNQILKNTKKSLKNYKDKDDEDYINFKYLDFNDYDDINCGENDVIYYKLNHFIDTYFDTDLSFYTEPISCKLYDNEPLYLGVFTYDNSVKNIKKIKKNYDMETFKTILELLNIDEYELNVYELDD